MAKLPPPLSTFWRGCLDALTSLRNAPSLWHASAHPHTPIILDLPCIPVQLACRVKAPSIRSLGDLSLQRLCQVAQPSAQKQRTLQQHLDTARHPIPTQVAFNRDTPKKQTHIGMDGALRPARQHTLTIAAAATVKASWTHTRCHTLPQALHWPSPAYQTRPLLSFAACQTSTALALLTTSQTLAPDHHLLPPATTVHVALSYHPFTVPQWHKASVATLPDAVAHRSTIPWAIPMRYAPWPLKNIPTPTKNAWLGLIANYLDLPMNRLWVIAAYVTPSPHYFEALPDFQSQHLQWGQCEALPKAPERFHYGPSESHPPGLWLVIRPLQLGGRQHDGTDRDDKPHSPAALLALAQQRHKNHHKNKGRLLKGAPPAPHPPNNGTPHTNAPINVTQMPSYWVCLPQALACFFEDPDFFMISPSSP